MMPIVGQRMWARGGWEKKAEGESQGPGRRR